MGVDLGGNRDLTAAAVVFPDEDGGFGVLLHYWMPEEKVQEASERDGVPYRAWIDEGWITATDGDYRDDARLLDELLALGAEDDVEEVCFDAWQMGYVATQLQDRGVTVVKVPQTFMELGPACEALEAAIGRGAVRPGDAVDGRERLGRRACGRLSEAKQARGAQAPPAH